MEGELDASKFRPQSIHATVLLCNQMIVQTTSFLNEFSQTVERKISNVSAKVTQLEILLAVLEAKINSVPTTEEVGPSQGESAASAKNEDVSEVRTSDVAEEKGEAPAPPPPPPPPPPSGSGGEEKGSGEGESQPRIEARIEEAAGPPPHFLKYQKMLKMGLPEAAVRMKMAQEGVDDSDVEAFLSGDYTAIKSQPLAIEEG